MDDSDYDYIGKKIYVNLLCVKALICFKTFVLLPFVVQKIITK
jgi:hypothetical protein